MTELLFFWR